MVNIIALTTSQTPRDDFMQDLLPLLPPEFSVKLVGALDNLTVEQIMKNYVPAPGEDTFGVRLRNGDMVEVSRKKELPLIQEAIHQAIKDGADAIIILCTMPFPVFESKVPLITPYDAMHWFVPAIASGLKVGTLFPYESHAAIQEKAWRDQGIDIVPKCLAPAEADGKAIAKLFENENIDMLVLDCVGFTAPARDEAQKLLKVPVIQPKQLIAGLLKVLF